MSLQEVQKAMKADSVLSKQVNGVHIIVMKFEKNQPRLYEFEKRIVAFEAKKSSTLFMFESDGKSKFRSFSGKNRFKDGLFKTVYNMGVPKVGGNPPLHEGVDVWPVVDTGSGKPGKSNSLKKELGETQEKLRETEEDLGEMREKLYAVTQEKQLLKEELEETQDELVSTKAELGVAREKLLAMELPTVTQEEPMATAWPQHFSESGQI
jgi:DNA repair exonuclease SbcCD ATPase subunit